MSILITAAAVANDVRMARSLHKGSFLLVEGSSDARTYKKFVDNSECRIIPAHGKDNVSEAIAILTADAIPGVLGIIDTDYSRLAGDCITNPNIVLTDTHDLETLIINSLACDRVVEELASPAKLEATLLRNSGGFRPMLLSAVTDLGYLRWTSQKHRHELTFEGVQYSEFIDRKTLEADLAALIRSVKNKSRAHSIPDALLETQIAALRARDHDPWHVCCGHDLVCALGLALQKVLGSRTAAEVTPEILRRELRLAYEPAHFRQTQLYAVIKSWETNNRPYRILAI